MTFHEHLAACPHCEVHPFDLCPTGQRLLAEEMWQQPIPARAPALVGVDSGRVERDEDGAAVRLFPNVRRSKR